jgi:Tfp pilus assembly protein PilN
MSRFLLGVMVDGEVLRLALVYRGLRETRLVDCLRIEELTKKQLPELTQQVRAFIEKNKATARRPVLVIPRSEFIVRKLDLPAEAEANLSKVVEYQVAGLLPSDDATVCYDFFHSKASKDAKSIGVTVFVLLKSVVEEKLRTCESIGLKMEKVVPSSAVLASCHALLPQIARKPNMGLGYAVGRSSEFATFSGGRLYQVQDLACGTEEELWEALQRESRVFRSQAQLADETPLDVFLFAPGLEVREVNPQDRLLKIHPITNLLQLGFSRGKTTLDAREVKDEFLPAMAALTSFQRKNTYSVNLLPPERRPEKSRWMWVPAYVLAGANLVLLLALGLRQTVQQEIYARQLRAEVRRLEPEIRKIKQVEAEMETYNQRSELLTNFKKSTVVNLGVLNELSLILPKNSWITSFVLRDQTVEIVGMSDEASKLLQILDTSPYFRNAEFTAPITRDAVGKEVFRIRMRIEALPPTAPQTSPAVAAKESS